MDLTALEESLRKGFVRPHINISVLAGASDASLQRQGTYLPCAAGPHDFNFYMYGADSQNNYLKQLSDEAQSKKYMGVSRLPLFPNNP